MCGVNDGRCQGTCVTFNFSDIGVAALHLLSGVFDDYISEQELQERPGELGRVVDQVLRGNRTRKRVTLTFGNRTVQRSVGLRPEDVDYVRAEPETERRSGRSLGKKVFEIACVIGMLHFRFGGDLHTHSFMVPRARQRSRTFDDSKTEAKLVQSYLSVRSLS